MNYRHYIFKGFASSVIVTSMISVVGLAQQALPTKDFTEWSRSEVESVLNNSAWVQKQELRIKFEKETQVAAGSYTPNAGVTDTSATNAKTEVTTQVPTDFIFTLRLRSSLPVRQALVRAKQLETNTAKMDQKQRAAFDAQLKGLLECPACTDNYVVTLSSKSFNHPGADAVFTTLKGGRLADLQRYVFIANNWGDRRPLVHFTPPRVPGDEATFFFPRLDDKGRPLLNGDSKELLINLSDNQPNSIANFKFDVAKLVLNGKVEF